MAIPLTEALLLGLIQGITESLPVSSDGHLALADMLFGDQADLATRVFLHLGTLGATLLLLRKRVVGALTEGLRGVFRPSLLKDTQGGRDAVVVALATVPTAILSLALEGPSEVWSSSPTVVGLCFLASALAIGSTRWVPKGPAKAELDTPSYWGAVIVGVAQGTAVLPGLSRCAMTLAALLWLGIKGERAFELSLLVSIPAILGTEILEGRHAFHGVDSASTLILGTCVAFVVGLGALQILRGVLLRRAVALFAIYLFPLGLATLAWGYARP
jgi:undecaprenyl-diphosphatase